MTIPAGYAQANIRFTGGIVPTGAECTIGIDLGVSSLTPFEVAEVVGGAWNASFQAELSDQMLMQEVYVKFGPDATGPSDTSTFASPGARPLAPLPANTAVLVRKITDLGGRAGRGRFYVPGFVETPVSGNGVIDATELGLLQAAADTFYGNLTAGDFGLVVLHQPGSPLSTPTPITGLAVDSTVATQRQRLRR